MMYRKLLATEVEELRRSHPIDGAVLMETRCCLRGAGPVGCPAAILKTGDEVDVRPSRSQLGMHFEVSEIVRRRAEWVKPEPRFKRGYGTTFQTHVTQADKGCDFDFLHAGAPTPKPEIF